MEGAAMYGWVVAALVLNAALVVVVIVYAIRLAGRTVVVAVELELKLHAPPVATSHVFADSQLPLFSPAHMTRTEWRALLEAFDSARAFYLKALTAWRNELPRSARALSQAAHDLEIARSRLERFERSVSSGPRVDAAGARHLRSLTPN